MTDEEKHKCCKKHVFPYRLIIFDRETVTKMQIGTFFD